LVDLKDLIFVELLKGVCICWIFGFGCKFAICAVEYKEDDVDDDILGGTDTDKLGLIGCGCDGGNANWGGGAGSACWGCDGGSACRCVISVIVGLPV